MVVTLPLMKITEHHSGSNSWDQSYLSPYVPTLFPIFLPSFPHLFPIFLPSFPHLFPIFLPSFPHLFPIFLPSFPHLFPIFLPSFPHLFPIFLPSFPHLFPIFLPSFPHLFPIFLPSFPHLFPIFLPSFPMFFHGKLGIKSLMATSHGASSPPRSSGVDCRFATVQWSWWWCLQDAMAEQFKTQPYWGFLLSQ